MKFLPFFFFVFVHFCFAQHKFHGRLVDNVNNGPIAFGHFSFGKQQGFISNDNGFFQFEHTADNIKLKISALGYSNKIVQFFSGKENIIYLSQKKEILNEVVLNYEDPAKTLIKKVVESIPLNYPIQQEQVYGYYRENAYYDSLHKQPIYKAEAYIKADKFSYHKKSKGGNVQLLENKIDVIDMDTLEIMFYGGAHSIHTEDYVLRRAGPLNLKKTGNYKLKIKDTLTYDNQTVIKLDYENKKVKGSFYIALESYALIRIEITKNPKEMDDFELINTYRRTFSTEIISYKKDDHDKWRLKFNYHKTGVRHKKKQEVFF